jgi:hypothetical protein
VVRAIRQELPSWPDAEREVLVALAEGVPGVTAVIDETFPGQT